MAKYYVKSGTLFVTIVANSKSAAAIKAVQNFYNSSHKLETNIWVSEEGFDFTHHEIRPTLLNTKKVLHRANS